MLKVKVEPLNMASTTESESTKNLNSTEFVQVKSKSRKRKIKQIDDDVQKPMDVSEPTVKRPNLPSISGDSLTVCRFSDYFLLFASSSGASMLF